MNQFDLLIHAPRAVTSEGERSVSIGIKGGAIVHIDEVNPDLEARESITLNPDEVLLPGLVDTHVHICEPGNTDWEGFLTATRAAAAGGITTLIDMPLDSLPTTVTLEALE